MADLLSRLGAIAVGNGPLLAPRPRARFEPSAPDHTDAWPGEEVGEAEAPVGWRAAAPRRTTAPGNPTVAKVDPAPGPASPIDPARSAAPNQAVVDHPSVPAPSGSPPADGEPAARDGVVGSPAEQPASPTAQPTVVHERDVIRQTTHEVARTERIDRGSEVVELIQWIEARGTESAPPAAADAPADPAAGGPPDDRTAPHPGTPVPAIGGMSVAPVAVAPPPAPAPIISVSIGRVEVRTVEPAAVRRPPPLRPAPPPAPLRFAGPSLDEFLDGAT